MTTSCPSKRCFVCGEVKPLGDFYKHPTMADGHLNKCKLCACRQSREYDKTPDGVATRKRYLAGKKGKEKALRNTKKMRQLYPDRWRARYAVANAIRDGRLKRQPCVVCGDAKSHGHHDDYSKPLDVIWLCQKHHSERHNKAA